MKLSPEILKYLTKEDFRVLTAVEMGMKNHEYVPMTLIENIAGLKRGGAFKIIGQLHKFKLIVHDGKKYDGYKLTYLGYDYLALKAMVNRGTIAAVGRRIGVGKESDIYEAINDDGEIMALKIHRLGRISFRAIKQKRDYLQHRKHASWLYLSRLAALREYAYMKALHDHGFPTPVPKDFSRHCILMSFVEGTPFSQVRIVERPGVLYDTLMKLIVKFAEHGLIHCDFNEFNLIIGDDEHVTVIDFPQMVSTSHRNADMYFARDVQCIRTIFEKKFRYVTDSYPQFKVDVAKNIELDKELDASGAGFSLEQLQEFDKYILRKNDEPQADEDDDVDPDADGNEEDEEDDEEEEEEEEVEEWSTAATGDDEKDTESSSTTITHGTGTDTGDNLDADGHEIELNDNRAKGIKRIINKPTKTLPLTSIPPAAAVMGDNQTAAVTTTSTSSTSVPQSTFAPATTTTPKTDNVGVDVKTDDGDAELEADVEQFGSDEEEDEEEEEDEDDENDDVDGSSEQDNNADVSSGSGGGPFQRGVVSHRARKDAKKVRAKPIKNRLGSNPRQNVDGTTSTGVDLADIRYKVLKQRRAKQKVNKGTLVRAAKNVNKGKEKRRNAAAAKDH